MHDIFLRSKYNSAERRVRYPNIEEIGSLNCQCNNRKEYKVLNENIPCEQEEIVHKCTAISMLIVKRY